MWVNVMGKKTVFQKNKKKENGKRKIHETKISTYIP